MNRLADDPDFAAAIEAAAKSLGIPAPVVEKDYWVTQALGALAGAHPDDWIFKGGTSLSKAYGLIERFSEDVDVLVLAGGRGSAACDTLMKSMARAVLGALGGEELPPSTAADKGVHRTYEIPYRGLGQVAGYLRPSVRLEMGVRGGAMPNEIREITALIARTDVLDAGDFGDLSPFSVRVLHPGRTLVEKLLLIHGVAVAIDAGGAGAAPAGFGRHLYDVHQLLGSEEVIAFLDRREDFLEVCEGAFAIGVEHFGTTADRPQAGFSASPAFTSAQGSSVADAMEAALIAASDLAFPDVSWPTLSALSARVASLNERL